jgi:hypothetical protein
MVSLNHALIMRFQNNKVSVPASERSAQEEAHHVTSRGISGVSRIWPALLPSVILLVVVVVLFGGFALKGGGPLRRYRERTIVCSPEVHHFAVNGALRRPLGFVDIAKAPQLRRPGG